VQTTLLLTISCEGVSRLSLIMWHESVFPCSNEVYKVENSRPNTLIICSLSAALNASDADYSY